MFRWPRLSCLATAALALAALAGETAPVPPLLPGSASPALEAAALALAADQTPAARDGFEAVLRDVAAPPLIRGLAWCGLARATPPNTTADQAAELRRRLAADTAVPAFYREAALRQLEAALGTTAPASEPRDRAEAPRGVVQAALARAQTPGQATVHVAPDGDDSNPGTGASPFRTLARAREAVQALKQAHAGRLPPGGVRVEIAGGAYPTRETVRFQASDSGTAEAPVVYRARDGQQPVFDGGIRLAAWTAVADASVRERLAPAARDRVLVADLKALGLTDYGDPTDLRRRPELFVDGVPQTLARWPNQGFVQTGALLGTDTFKVWNSINGCRDGRFRYVEDRPGTWADEPDVRLYGYWFWDWYEEFQKVARIDPADRSFTLARPYSQYGYRQGQRYYALNVLRELDEPGEWYLDRARGAAYWWPPAGTDPAKAETVLSLLHQPFITLEETTHLAFVGLTFQHARGDGIHAQGGSDCLIAGCTLRRLGGDGVVMQAGHRHGLFGCHFETLGCGGARLAGGDRRTIVPGEHFIENCTVADISRLKRTYTPAVHLDGCGLRVAHNLFERMPSSAMRIEGNDHLVEYNRIRNVVQESDDQGGIDMFGNPLYRGVVIRWNRWSDIRGGTHNGAAGVRLDDMISGVVVHGNVFERCGAVAFGGVQIHGGKDNWIDGNLFVDCFAGISFSRWGEQRWREGIEKFLAEAADPVQTARYPDLARIRTGADVNSIARNLFVRSGTVFLRDAGVSQRALNASLSGAFDLEELAAGGGEATRALQRTLLFEPIPLQRMGPYPHPWRADGGGALRR